MTDGSFSGVPNVQSSAEANKEIDKNQFYQALVDSISARLMPESEKPTIECVSILLFISWPSTVSSEYGGNELRLACSKFLVPFPIIT